MNTYLTNGTSDSKTVTATQKETGWTNPTEGEAKDVNGTVNIGGQKVKASTTSWTVAITADGTVSITAN